MEEDYVEESESMTFKTWIKKYGLYLVGVLAWLLLRNRLGSVEILKGDWWFMLTIGGMLLVNLSWLQLKNGTPKIIADGIFSTTSGQYATVGNFAVFRLNEIDCGIKIPPGWKYGKGAVICPLDAINKRGRSVALQIQVNKVSKNELPLEVQEHLTERKIKEPYYIGYADIEQLDEEVDFEKMGENKVIDIFGAKKTNMSTLVSILKDQYRALSEKDELLKGRRQTFEKELQYQSRLGMEKSAPRKWLEEKRDRYL